MIARAVVLAVALAACQPPSPMTTRPAPPAQQLALLDLVGGWRWLYHIEEQGTARTEDERWRLDAAGAGEADVQHRVGPALDERPSRHRCRVDRADTADERLDAAQVRELPLCGGHDKHHA